MSSAIIHAQNISTDKITFSEVKVLESGGKCAYVNYDGGKFFIQTPTFTMPHGLSVYDKTSPPKYTIEFSLRGWDEPGTKGHEVYTALHALDEFMIDQGVKNSQKWFKAKMSREVVEALYTPMIRWSKDKDGNLKPYPPGIKWKLNKVNDSFDVKVFDLNKQEYRGVPLEDILVKQATGKSVAQCTGLWFINGKFVLSWKAVQIGMDNVPKTINGYAFADDGEQNDTYVCEDDDAFTDKPATTTAAVASSSLLSSVLPPKVAPVAPSAPPETTEEDLEEDITPEEVAPPPVPAKKTVATVAPGAPKKGLLKKVVK